MSSKIYIGTIAHSRKGEIVNDFSYPLYMYAIDLDELGTLHKTLTSFSYNGFNLVSIWDKDYLTEKPLSIKEKLLELLDQEGCGDDIEKVILLTNLRYMNYVFNPMSAYYCFRKDGTLRCCLVEVNNTFGDKHVYIVDNPLHAPTEEVLGHFKVTKGFHVSPFYDLKGDYEFRFSDIREKLLIQFDMQNENNTIFKAKLTGKKSYPLTELNIFKTLLRYPLTAWLTMPRILWQAGKLYFIKKLPFYSRPKPMNEKTIRQAPAKPTTLEKIAMKAILSFFNHIKKGHLTLKLPDGSTHSFGEPSAKTNFLDVHHYAFFYKLITRGEIGLGETYVDQDWDTNDLTALLTLFSENAKNASAFLNIISFPNSVIDKIRHYLRENTIDQAKDNIKEHYDIMNEMFFKFLDSRKVYSSALFHHEEETLEEAQLKKINRIIQLAEIKPSSQVLEIGFGWGGFAIEATAQTGCDLTGITLSNNQLNYVQKLVREKGLDQKIHLEFADYRLKQGQYDRIVSIEMLEAVGEKYLSTYFKKIDELLKPGGIAVIQTITYPDQEYDRYKKSTDWIKKHIFPGGHLPSLQIIHEIVEKDTSLKITSQHSIGLSYAKTLAIWRDNFLLHKEDILKLGFDEAFIRKWIYYFSYCEAGFKTKFIDDYQIVLKKL